LEEDRLRPIPLSGEDIIRYAAWRESYLQLGGRENGPGDPVHVTGVKRLSALFELDYWQVMQVRSFMFVIHVHNDVELDTLTSASVKYIDKTSCTTSELTQHTMTITGAFHLSRRNSCLPWVVGNVCDTGSLFCAASTSSSHPRCNAL
jgi:hypothetical protein